MTIVPNSLHEPTVKTDTKFVDFCRDVQKSQVDVEMFSENRAKLPHITLPPEESEWHRGLGIRQDWPYRQEPFQQKVRPLEETLGV